MIPRLHVVTDDLIAGRDDFTRRAAAVIVAGGPRIAFHLRAPAIAGGRLYELASALRGAARTAGATLLVNDRVDVAMAAGADGVHLGERSIAPSDARRLLPRALVGRSTHSVADAAAADATDFVFLGTIHPTASHRHLAPLGIAAVAAAATRASVPVIAIGGMLPAGVAEVLRAGAAGVAAVGGIWSEDDPAARVHDYLDAIAAAEGG